MPAPDGADPVAIVTGGSSGPGRELASALASRGLAVVVVHLGGDADPVVDAILAAGGMAVAVRADVTDELDVERLLDETTAAFGGADLVVHAAGPDASVLLRQAARRLRRAGAVVRVSRAEAMAPAVARELRARDITVNGLAPGLEPPGPDHDVSALLALVDAWRRGDAAQGTDQGMPGRERRGPPATVAPTATHGGDPVDDIGTLAELLHETAERHDRFEKAAAPHDWWDWYAPYLSARQHGSTPDEASAAADRYMEEVHHVGVR